MKNLFYPLIVTLFVLAGCDREPTMPEMVRVIGISIKTSSETLHLEQLLSLEAIVLPEDATNKTVLWSSSDKTIAMVSEEGVVTALAAGEAVITATTEDGKFTASRTVTVNIPLVPVTGVAVNIPAYSLDVEKTVSLRATVLPEDATNKTVLWSSSDEAIATVSNEGVVIAIADGEAVITATTEDGKFTASCSVFNESIPRTSWDYPIKPGTPEWAEFKTSREMIEACRVPEWVLNSVMTEDLIGICLNYPLFDDIWFYDSSPMGFMFESNTEVMQELFRREDNVKCLLELLKGRDLLNNPYKAYGRPVLRHAYLEFLLCHPSVVANASDEQQKEISEIALQNMIIKWEQSDIYAHVESSAYLLCSYLTEMNDRVFLSPVLERFLYYGYYRDTNIYEELRQFAPLFGITLPEDFPF